MITTPIINLRDVIDIRDFDLPKLNDLLAERGQDVCLISEAIRLKLQQQAPSTKDNPNAGH